MCQHFVLSIVTFLNGTSSALLACHYLKPKLHKGSIQRHRSSKASAPKSKDFVHTMDKSSSAEPNLPVSTFYAKFTVLLSTCTLCEFVLYSCCKANCHTFTTTLQPKMLLDLNTVRCVAPMAESGIAEFSYRKLGNAASAGLCGSETWPRLAPLRLETPKCSPS